MTDLSWDIREEIIDPSSSSLKSIRGTSVCVSTTSIIEAGSGGRGEGGGRDKGKDGWKEIEEG